MYVSYTWPRRVRRLSAAAITLAAIAPAAAGAQSVTGGRFSMHPFFGSNTGGWSKTEESTAPGGAPHRFEFGSGPGAGLRVAFAVVPHLGIWAAAELNVEQEAPFAGAFAGVEGRAMIGARTGVQARLGAGRLENGPFGVAGATVEWFALRPLSLGIGVETAQPIGTGRRNNGLQDVPVDYDGGPTRVRLELGWYPGR
jgi:hypothetical protein